MTTTKLIEIVDGRVVCEIPLTDESGAVIGKLEPLTLGHVDSDELVDSMTRWRNRASRFFMTQFEATPERTRAWLSDTILIDQSRLLCLIHSSQKVIGHYGFKNLTADSAELDNLVRGEPGGHPKLIYHAEIGLIRWLFSSFAISRIYAHVLADNNAVLDLHRSIGFVNEALIPLTRIESSGLVTLEYGSPGGTSPDRLYCQKIVLHRSRFEEGYPRR